MGYIPTTEAERIEWLKRFDTWMQTNGASYGFTAQERKTEAARPLPTHHYDLT